MTREINLYYTRKSKGIIKNIYIKYMCLDIFFNVYIIRDE